MGFIGGDRWPRVRPGDRVRIADVPESEWRVLRPVPDDAELERKESLISRAAWGILEALSWPGERQGLVDYRELVVEQPSGFPPPRPLPPFDWSRRRDLWPARAPMIVGRGRGVEVSRERAS